MLDKTPKIVVSFALAVLLKIQKQEEKNMLTILILTGIGVVVALIRHRKKEAVDKWFNVFMYGGIALFISMILLLVAIPLTTEKQMTLSDEKELVIFRDNREISGIFFLGIGSPKNQRYYEFYYREPCDSGAIAIKYGRISINETAIYEKEGLSQGLLKTYIIEKEFTKPLYKWFVAKGESIKRYEIWLPKGSIGESLILELR